MELISIPFASAEDFLQNVDSGSRPGPFYSTRRQDLKVGSAVLMEISFPELPSPTYLRGILREAHSNLGYSVTVLPTNENSFSFAVEVARGEIDADKARPRVHNRVPVSVPVDCRIEGRRLMWVEAQTVNLSPGGAFVRSNEAPEVGARVRMVIGPTTRGDRFLVYGAVASRGTAGFGVRFSSRVDGDAGRLRQVLRKSAEAGKVAFA